MSAEAFDPYVVLGVPRTASAEEITTAWRRAAMTAHPDRGGSTEAMVDVNMAYKVLSDPVLRAQYDAGGGMEGQETLASKAQNYLIKMLQSVIRNSPADKDLIVLLREAVHTNQYQCSQRKAQTLTEIAMLRERVKRLHGPAGNFIETVLLSEIGKGEALLPVYDADQEVMLAALKILMDYRYDAAAGYGPLSMMLGDGYPPKEPRFDWFGNRDDR